MKKSLFQSALLHLILIIIFFSLHLPIDLPKKNNAIQLTVGPPDITAKKTPSEEETEPNTESVPTPLEPDKPTDKEQTETSAKPKSEVSNLPAEIPAEIMPLLKSAPKPHVSMQKSSSVQPESSPEIYGSIGLDSYYYNKPMEAFSSVYTTQSPAKKPQQQYIVSPLMQGAPKIPMQKPSMAKTGDIPSITLLISKNINTTILPATNTVKSNGETIASVQEIYIQDIQQKLETYKIYPDTTETGSVKMKLTIAEDGKLIKMDILESSGSETLDTMGAVLLKNIEKFEAIPDALKKELIDIILTIDYK